MGDFGLTRFLGLSRSTARPRRCVDTTALIQSSLAGGAITRRLSTPRTSTTLMRCGRGPAGLGHRPQFHPHRHPHPSFSSISDDNFRSGAFSIDHSRLARPSCSFEFPVTCPGRARACVCDVITSSPARSTLAGQSASFVASRDHLPIHSHGVLENTTLERCSRVRFTKDRRTTVLRLQEWSCDREDVSLDNIVDSAWACKCFCHGTVVYDQWRRQLVGTCPPGV